MFENDGEVSCTFVERGRIRLDASVVWEDELGRTEAVTGYKSDGGTIPAILWPLFFHPFSGIALPCWVIHDWDVDKTVGRTLTRGQAHKRLYHMLRARNVGRLRASMVYAGVWALGPRW